MAQFKAYPKYKDSGVEWLGEVPEHWKISNIKRSTYLKGRVGWKGLTSNEFEVNSFAYLVTGTDFKQKYVNWSSCYQINESRYEDDPYIQLKNGDLLMTKDGTIGKLAIVKNLNKSACLNSGIFLIRPEKYYSTEFMYWVLNSNAFNLFFVMNTTGSTILHLYQNVFERFVFSYPNFKEQERIVSYLNLETAKIDTLIAKQEKLIELLEEQRKSVISHAVTKGLDPNAPMKDSGVEWLGEVPEHWGSCKLKYIAKVYAGGTPDRNRLDFWSNGNIPWINSGAVNQIDISEPSEYITELGFNLSSAKYIPKNSLVIALAGQGKTKGMVAYTSIETTCNQSMAAIVTHNYYFKFLFYWLSANYQKIRNLTGGNNRDGLNLVILGDIVCPQINTSEQTQIANYLDKETAKIDVMIKKQKLLIEKLKEYRASVISYAVTGKIDVRELAA